MDAGFDMSKDLEKIIKEGFLDKESRFIKTWRKRWFVLTANTLYTFKERKEYSSPTEVMPLRTITSIKSCDDETNKQFTFKLESSERTFYVGATTAAQKQQWIGQIGKAMVKLNARDPDFD